MLNRNGFSFNHNNPNQEQSKSFWQEVLLVLIPSVFAIIVQFITHELSGYMKRRRHEEEDDEMEEENEEHDGPNDGGF